jgi:hypothetical protein
MGKRIATFQGTVSAFEEKATAFPGKIFFKLLTELALYPRRMISLATLLRKPLPRQTHLLISHVGRSSPINFIRYYI